MLAVPLIITPIAFAGGLYLAARFFPPLAPTRTGRLAARVVDLLLGVAATILALDLYLTIRSATGDVFEGFDRGDGVARGLVDTLGLPGLLLAGATTVHLLAPPGDEEEPVAAP